MRYALISHGTDRINNYANFGALAAFSYPRTQILRIPADALARRGSDQQAMLRTYHDIRTKQQTKSSGSSSSTSIQIHPYAGFRCTQDERQFYIRDAIVHLLYICLGADSSLHITQSTKKFKIWFERVAIQIWNCYDKNKRYIGQATLFDRQKVEFMDL